MDGRGKEKGNRRVGEGEREGQVFGPQLVQEIMNAQVWIAAEDDQSLWCITSSLRLCHSAFLPYSL